MLDVSGAEKRFGDTRALDGATLSVGEGEWLGLLGPNGAGKTTLVRSIVGRVALDGGTIRLGDQVLDASDAAKRAREAVGFIPQDVAVYPQLTAEENLRAWGELNGVTDGLDEQVDWALTWTGLGDRTKERVEGFSGGMKRRLNLACGILHRPRLILLDEPTVGVDPQSRQRIWDMLKELHAGGVSILLTTHQLDEAQQVCERIAILDHGKTLANGTFGELLDTTIGRGRMVRFRVDDPSKAPETFEREGEDGLRMSVTDVATGLPDALAALNSAGADVRDVDVQAPTLQDVFIHLTGRELRE